MCPSVRHRVLWIHREIESLIISITEGHQNGGLLLSGNHCLFIFIFYFDQMRYQIAENSTIHCLIWHINRITHLVQPACIRLHVDCCSARSCCMCGYIHAQHFGDGFHVSSFCSQCCCVCVYVGM